MNTINGKKHAKILKQMLGCILLLAVCFAMSISMTGCSEYAQKNNMKHAKERIYDITGIEIPSEAEPIYSFFDSTFVNGRRAQLVVFEFDEEPTEWIEDNKFKLWEAGKVDPFFLKDFQFMTLKDEINEIPKEYQPNFEEVSWHKYDKNHMVYFYYYPSNQRLIVFIVGT